MNKNFALCCSGIGGGWRWVSDSASHLLCHVGIHFFQLGFSFLVCLKGNRVLSEAFLSLKIEYCTSVEWLKWNFSGDGRVAESRGGGIVISPGGLGTSLPPPCSRVPARFLPWRRMLTRGTGFVHLPILAQPPSTGPSMSGSVPEAGNPRSRCWQGWFLLKFLLHL